MAQSNQNSGKEQKEGSKSTQKQEPKKPGQQKK